jgi:hypothetical protein
MRPPTKGTYEVPNRSCLSVSAACLALAAVAYGSGRGYVASVTAKHSPRVCFPAGKLGPAPQRYAPCVRIRRVYEDGSFTYAVSDRDGTVRYSAGVGALDR